MIKRFLNISLFIILGLLVFGVLYLAADALLSRISTNPKLKSLDAKYKVYILSNGVHTDIVLPVKSDLIDWHRVFSPADIRSKDTSYDLVSIGWGDKGFYLNTPEWKDLTLKTALVAGLGIGETALHVTYYKTLSENENCYRVMIDEEQYRQLIDYIKGSIDTDVTGRPILIDTDAQYGDDDAFYEAKGAYSLFFSCNTWTNRALKSASMPSGVWTVFDKGILRHYQK